MAEKRRILVVEDEAPVRELVARHLSKKGYEVTEAADAEQVLLQMSRDRVPFDLVLTDIHLPGLSGVELLRLLLTHSPLRPVLMITGDADEGLARRALGFGATGYLLKPFQLFELDAAVRQALARLELVEAAGALARSADGKAVAGSSPAAHLPPAWLELADSRSSAGAGHGSRVARMAAALASALPAGSAVDDRSSLDVAARAHELGRLLGPPRSAAELATRTAQLLYDLGVDARVLRVINNLRERWNGSGGPNGIAGTAIPIASRVLAAADALDHAAVVHLEAGQEPGGAMAQALEDLRETTPDHHGPDVAAAIEAASGVIEAIWVLARGRPEAPVAGVVSGAPVTADSIG